MTTPYTPAVCRCPKCSREYIEWFETGELVGLLANRVKKTICDGCYSPGLSDVVRQSFVSICSKRRIELHNRCWKDCDKSHLDRLAIEIANRGPHVYADHTSEHKLPQRSQASQSIPDKTCG